MKYFNEFSRWLKKRGIVFVAFMIYLIPIFFIWGFLNQFSISEPVTTIAIAAWSALFAALGSFATLLQAIEMQKQRENFERPYVLIHFDIRNDGAIYLAVENFGNTPALNITIDFTPPIIDHRGRSVQGLSTFQKPIRFMPPKNILKQFIGVGHDFLSQGKDVNFIINVCYESPQGGSYREAHQIDLSYLRETTRPPKTLEEQLESLNKSITDLAGIFKSVKGYQALLVETPEQQRSRINEDLEQGKI